MRLKRLACKTALSEFLNIKEFGRPEMGIPLLAICIDAACIGSKLDFFGLCKILILGFNDQFKFPEVSCNSRDHQMPDLKLDLRMCRVDCP